ncbi:porin family protein [Winogradskyella sp. UBA3174]|uniref:porin family protein n=1 Tax=Winogradskyella sp. UBA3174 TaxID=1947785 RepID=UPI0025D89BF1|nr:porin family protein [Winogradskyella sp. UBA3174]|tara:strand:- start:13566 stop:14270 length:705 start_codon:yes stop_codon:yes gene_type:complete
MNRNVFFFLLLIGGFSFAQNSKKTTKSQLYEDYREDQFYVSITYNLLSNKPENENVSQSGFSSGFHFGFIRDMPINERRNKALGIGIGISTNSYNQNISILEIDNEITYGIIDESEINVSKNKFTTYLVEVPFEFRWRTSTRTDYNFWRIYTGFKLGYLVYNTTKFKSNAGDVNLLNLDDFNRLQYGLTLSIGYSTWNFHAYYGLNPIFGNNARLGDNGLDIKSFKIGLMFYIL